MDSANAPKTKTDTKYNLILSALELFAENGIDAVSMRTINNAAGTRNASAVHYHFGNKIGIIEAIIAFIREELDASRLDALTALERRVRNGERPVAAKSCGPRSRRTIACTTRPNTANTRCVSSRACRST